MLAPTQRNFSRFHIRHFFSEDGGTSWRDKGCYMSCRDQKDTFDSRSIWSGSVLEIRDGRVLCAYTGLRAINEKRLFQQSLALVIGSDFSAIKNQTRHLLLDPERDRDMILQSGYYLSDADNLGHKDGEQNGPIMAWRDPYLYEHDGEIHCFWSAKKDYKTPALGHARLKQSAAGFEVEELYPAITMPDGHLYTQLEVPKVVYDNYKQRFLMLVSSCNRLHEGQSDAEAEKHMRLYQAKSINGPWTVCGHEGSKLELSEAHFFGASFIKADWEKQTISYIAPYTEEAGEGKFLTLSPIYQLDIGQLG